MTGTTERNARAHLVCGMHRSGTSMVASLLRRHGVDFGPDDELVAAAADNPGGFVEHRSVVALDDALLAALGGAWDAPPELTPEWWLEDRLGGLRHRTRLLIDGFAARALSNSALSDSGDALAHWGIKDPRLSLTAPMWRSLLEDHRIVVCVRNPLEVAASLVARHGCSTHHALGLWQRYHRALDEAVPPEQRVVLHYGAVLNDPETQTRRLLDVLGVRADPSGDTAAPAPVDRGERHHRFGLAELAHVGAARELIDRYLALCDEARWREPATVTGAAAPPPAPPGAPLDLDALERVRLHADLHVRGGHLALLQRELDRLRAERPAVAAPSALAAPTSALVVQHRLPEFDRDRGSVRVLETVEHLRASGCRVDFWALDLEAAAVAADESQTRYRDRLVELGATVHLGADAAVQQRLRDGEFELCLAAFWHVAERVLPLVRAPGSRTRFVVDSIDLHLLRESRRLSDELGDDGRGGLDDAAGVRFARELNVYAAADRVLTVSDKEAELVDELVGRPDLAASVPLGDPMTPSPLRHAHERSGLLFVGNFAHLPNIEAVEHLTREVLPRLPVGLLAEHHATVVGNALDERVRAVGDFPHTELLGWVPDITEHLHRARVVVVPLLHGAGVKGKVVQALLAGTPVVSTEVGVEGLGLDPGDPACPVVVANDAASFAGAVSTLLTDDDEWQRRAAHARSWAEQRHGAAVVRDALLGALDGPVHQAAPASVSGSRRWAARYDTVRDQVRAAVAQLPEQARCLVLSGGDEQLVAPLGRSATHFPADEHGWALGWHPDGDELVNRLLAATSQGWDHLVMPSTQFWQLHRHDELAELTGRAELVHDGGECRVWRLGDPERVLVHVDGAVPDADAVRALLHAELSRSERDVLQLATELDAPAPTPLLTRQLGAKRRDVFGLGAGPAIAARGAAAEALHRALEGDHRALQHHAHHVVDEHAVRLEHRVEPVPCSGRARVLSLWTPEGHRELGAPSPARVSVVIATRDRAELLDGCLASVLEQDPARIGIEVVVVDDGSTDHTPEVIGRWSDELSLRSVRIGGHGRSAAKNLGISIASASLVLLLDDDDRLLPHAISEYLGAHDAADPLLRARLAVLGRTDWAPELELSQLSRHLTEVGCQLFSYPSVPEGTDLDWRHFWEGRLLVPRALLVTTGLHDQRLDYTIDIELGRRLDVALGSMGGLVVRHCGRARSVMARQMDLQQAVARQRAKGRARAMVAQLHPADAELQAYCAASGTATETELLAQLDETAAAQRRAAAARPGPDRDQALEQLHRCYAQVLRSADLLGGDSSAGEQQPAATAPASEAAAPLAPEHTQRSAQPELSIVVPVWSVTPELADMAASTIARLREVAVLRSEIIVIDNGSPHVVELGADRLVRLEQNRGVAPAWNLGASIAAAPLLAFVNSDCWVEPGWDRALAHAATDGRRIAFPHTDHGDGLGARRPDQAGTAGWCFVLHRELLAEVGGFDESFAPAYFEDTDHWHRAWEMGVELSPVPAAVVRHQRRTTGAHLEGADELFVRNRRRYEAKHGVAQDAPPPFYAREVHDYPPPGRLRLARLRPWASEGTDRPRVFGLGLPKTGTSSLHAALSHLGFTSVHHGDADLRRAIDRAAAAGAPLLGDVDPELDAFCDVPGVVANFAALDAQHPGSKFVLTVRDDESWIDSRTRHVRRNRDLAARGAYDGDFVHLDVDRWRAERDAHHDAVLGHFAGRPDDLLVLDVCAGQGWERLAPFLGWERLPERPFPHENATTSDGAAETTADAAGPGDGAAAGGASAGRA